MCSYWVMCKKMRRNKQLYKFKLFKWKDELIHSFVNNYPTVGIQRKKIIMVEFISESQEYLEGKFPYYC